MRREYDISTFEAKWAELKDKMVDAYYLEGRDVSAHPETPEETFKLLRLQAFQQGIDTVFELMDELERTDTIIK